jgi:hypothetical protein
MYLLFFQCKLLCSDHISTAFSETSKPQTSFMRRRYDQPSKGTASSILSFRGLRSLVLFLGWQMVSLRNLGVHFNI